MPGPGISIRWAGQPKRFSSIPAGDLIVRRRDECSTKAMVCIAVGGDRGLVPLDKVNSFGAKLIKLIEEHQ